MSTPTTRARRRDPATSKAAGEQVTALRASQARVLSMFRLYGDMHDKQLLAYLHDAEQQAGLKEMSPSGARSRRSELAKPNMDRLEEIAREMVNDRERVFSGFDDFPTATQDAARKVLRAEGFRSPLWDTGRREIVDGRSVIVWGIAQ